jgi:replicative DNA helicase
LRESGAQEQDAHVVLLIHRQREANSATKADATKLIIAKQRQGPVGTIDLQFMPKLTRFCDASRREEERPW